MKAVVVKHPGGPEVLEYIDVATPEVKPGWSLVQVKGFGINHSEIFTRQGYSPNVKFPRILGIEAVGVIAETTDSDNLPKGQQVMSFMGEMGREFDGGYAEYVLLPNEQIYPINSNLSWEDLATIPETYYTAYGALLGLQLKDGDSLLVRGGTSGVGVAATKLAKAINSTVQVSGTTRNLAKSDLLKKVGYDEVIQDVDGDLKTSLQYDKILDLIGPKTIKDSLGKLAMNGIASCTGELGGEWTVDDFEPIGDIPNNRYLTSFASADVSVSRLHDLLHLIADKHVDVKPTKVFTLEDVKKAHEYLEGNHSFGKVVILVK
ncbi:zinc-binding alcohol dehydrogenase family protein [Companilactobacillus mishanensis]|uniref:Zinc-binding dehydrogenase n=1 Tax=Companilactobacillus mishanensis TaxID=2486008 RepID=A0ABW9P3I0_9LACO|nr:zinc-binding alcohol dehydrogenase family protein [Companilactobacillus mishanensis]MQS43863.1 zinc-binding dehydrogenase [Companilactobacillus mishanensis]MQS90234.1 zinc-binding dehydrogenase [Companilactobacillus mishanensis]